MSYGKITEYWGIERAGIKSAAIFLAALSLTHIERMPSEVSTYGVFSGYRLAHLEPYTHMRTRGRRMDAEIDLSLTAYSNSDS